TVGDFAAFFSAMLMVLGPLKRLVRINEHVQRGLAACESIFGLLDEEEEADGTVEDIGRVRGEIAISDLSFRYHDRQPPVLDGIHVHIRPGETVALVGASGSGKTTLAHLLPRFYDHSEGSITIDGHDVRDLSLASLRANIAMVSQDIVLFNDTVRANIAYGGNSDADEAAVIAAAEAAHAMDFIRALPAGLDTALGEGGVQLSGGQRHGPGGAAPPPHLHHYRPPPVHHRVGRPHHRPGKWPGGGDGQPRRTAGPQWRLYALSRG
ncbi:MAG: ATP-binding cassette domain-containing protein, partial [Gammaproteobacteria bacterium]